MERTTRKAFRGLAQLMLIMGLLVFAPAGTVHWGEAWLVLGVFFGASLAVTSYLARHDPKLLERRVQAGPTAEKRTSQKLIQVFASAAFVSLLAVPGFDHRYRWSRVPPSVVAAGDALVALGFLIVFVVFRENTFTSAVIEVDVEQRVIDTGPYAWVRHPMYAGSLLLVGGIPVGLGSFWGLLTVVPMVAIIVWRLFDEERFLSKELRGYDAYRAKVRYRLIPYLW